MRRTEIVCQVRLSLLIKTKDDKCPINRIKRIEASTVKRSTAQFLPQVTESVLPRCPKCFYIYANKHSRKGAHVCRHHRRRRNPTTVHVSHASTRCNRVISWHLSNLLQNSTVLYSVSSEGAMKTSSILTYTPRLNFPQLFVSNKRVKE